MCPLCLPQVYEGGSNVDQFVTRFLLKETASQIQSLLSSVESAVEAIEEQTSQIRCGRWAGLGRLPACLPCSVSVAAATCISLRL